MKIFCIYSGITFEVQNFSNISIRAPHPLFGQSLTVLHQKLDDWALGKLTANEARILFLAFLHSTDLIEFRTAAKPSIETVEDNMKDVAKLATWVAATSISPKSMYSLPHLAITAENHRLENIRVSLKIWEQNKADYADNYREATASQQILALEQRLYKLIHSDRSTEQNASMLAAWAMKVGKVPEELVPYWTDLFRLSGFNVYSARNVDLQELVEHMEQHLERYAGTVYANNVLRHLRDLLRKNTIGPLRELGDVTEYRILPDEIELQNRAIITATAPEFKPQPQQYPIRLLYLRALAAWELAKSEAETRAEVEAERAAVLQQDELDSSMLAEDAESDDDTIDINEI